MTVRELGERLDRDELVKWMAVFEIEQEQQDRDDLNQTAERELALARSGI